MKTQLGTMECALASLFDYAGMFPPAELDLQAALRDYRSYRRGEYAWALGNLVVNADAAGALAEAAQRDVSFSLLATYADLEMIGNYLNSRMPIDAVELRVKGRDQVLHWRDRFSASVATYVEVSIEAMEPGLLDALGEAGIHAKLRMGGVIAEAFPHPAAVATILKSLAERRIAFKATAGLHHPLRSLRPLTYRQNSEYGMMHGFMNLICASALVWFGGDAEEATQLLEEQDSRAFRISSDAICWRSFRWSAEQLREVRERFLIRIGSCSFTEPMNDLEALGWL